MSPNLERLYRIDVRMVGYAYVRSAGEALRFAATIVRDWDPDDARARLVHDRGEYPPQDWDAGCLVFCHGQEELTLGDVWPGDPLPGEGPT